MLSKTRLFLMLSAPLAMLAAAPAFAGNIGPVEADQTQIGDVSVSTFYTPTSNGYRVVTTAQSAGEHPSVVRYVTTLMPGQETVVSVPQSDNGVTAGLRIARIGDHVSVNRIGAMTE